MKIGMIGAWNSDSGASIHAELVGRSWVELGHRLSVFSFYKTSFHGTAIVGKDEDYVARCFTTSNAKTVSFDARPILSADYEIFVAQDHGMIPNDPLGKIFHWIKNKARTVCVIHDGGLKDDPAFYQFDWDAIVCFDKRYEDFLKLAYPKDRIFLIPYPCHKWVIGNELSVTRSLMQTSRKKLNLPLDKKIIFLFGPASYYGAEVFPTIDALGEKYPIYILIVTDDKNSLNAWNKIKPKNGKIEIRRGHPYIEEIYTYLYASDIALYNKPSKGGAVVSSMAYQCLGAGRPIVALDSNFVANFGDAVMKYKNKQELRRNIISVFEKDERFVYTMKKAKEFADKNNGMEVAKKFIALFESLLS